MKLYVGIADGDWFRYLRSTYADGTRLGVVMVAA